MATKELLEARHSTPLEIEFENSMTGGMKQVKERIRLANEAVQTKTKQAEEMEAETERLKTGHEIAIETQQTICRQLRDGELKLEIIQDRIERVEKKLFLKEEYLRESLRFEVGESIGLAKQKDQVLKDKKKIYMENRTKLDKASQKKDALDLRQQSVEGRTTASREKVKELKYKLLQLNEEQKRQEKEWLVSKERAVSTSSESERRQSEADDAYKRLEDAVLQVDLLKVDIANKEQELEKLTKERKSKEEYIRRFFTSAMQQVDLINT